MTSIKCLTLLAFGAVHNVSAFAPIFARSAPRGVAASYGGTSDVLRMSYLPGASVAGSTGGYPDRYSASSGGYNNGYNNAYNGGYNKAPGTEWLQNDAPTLYGQNSQYDQQGGYNQNALSRMGGMNSYQSYNRGRYGNNYNEGGDSYGMMSRYGGSQNRGSEFFPKTERYANNFGGYGNMDMNGGRYGMMGGNGMYQNYNQMSGGYNNNYNNQMMGGGRYGNGYNNQMMGGNRYGNMNGYNNYNNQMMGGNRNGYMNGYNQNYNMMGGGQYGSNSPMRQGMMGNQYGNQYNNNMMGGGYGQYNNNVMGMGGGYRAGNRQSLMYNDGYSNNVNRNSMY